MVFVDSNIPMYLVGAPHPNKEAAIRLLDRLIRDEARLVTSVEVLQEILHRYLAIGRLDAVNSAFDALLAIVDEVFDVTLADGLRAKEIVLGRAGLSARDALHIAVMERESVHTSGRDRTSDLGFGRVGAGLKPAPTSSNDASLQSEHRNLAGSLQIQPPRAISRTGTNVLSRTELCTLS